MAETLGKIEELAKLVEKGYKNISLVNSEKRIFEPVDRDLNVDYVQLAYKFIMPRWIFEGNASSEQIASNYANGLVRSEILYLIKKMGESQKARMIYSIKDINRKKLSDHFQSLENATDLFIPNSIVFSNSFCSFLNPNPYFQLEERDYIKIGNKRLRVHMSNKYLPFDKIFVLDSSGVTWSQKKVKDMMRSREKDPEGLKLLTSEDDILQISTKINEDNSVLFLMRIVAGVSIDPEKVRMINVSKRLLEEKSNDYL